MKKEFGAKARLLFTDTDSLMYEVETPDFFEYMRKGRFEHFDMSNFDPAGPNYSPDMQQNKARVGMMKEECGGQPITEFVGLRPKMYSFKYLKRLPDGSYENSEKHRAKGIQRVAAARLQHDLYREQLNHPEENYVLNRRLGSRLHQIYGIEVEFPSLSPHPFLTYTVSVVRSLYRIYFSSLVNYFLHYVT